MIAVGRQKISRIYYGGGVTIPLIMYFFRNKMSVAEPYLCEYCGIQFGTMNKLTVRIRIHTGEKPYKCDQCDKSFRLRKTLIVHFRLHKGEKPYKCLHYYYYGRHPIYIPRKKQCGKCFASEEHLTSHILAIHGGEKPFGCHLCFKSFYCKKNFEAHLKNIIH